MSDKRFDQLEAKVDKLDEKVDNINVTLAVNTESLKQHVEGVMQTRELISLQREELDARLAPIEKTHTTFLAAAKFLGLLLGSTTAIIAVLKVFKVLK